MTPLRRLQQLLQQRVGLALDDESLALSTYMHERTGQLGLSDAMQFVQRVASEPLTSSDWTKLIALATNPLTYFFRDASQLESAVTFLQQAAREHPGRKLQILSAACSTGEEPYTLAMLCRMRGLESSILATDINRAALEVGRRGVYARWSLRHVESSVAVQFFVPSEGGRFAVCEGVRSAVKFAEHNLTASELLVNREAPTGWDLILCRNVLIYYPLPERQAIVERLTRALRPGGVLYLGSSERVRDYERGVRAVVIAGRHALVRVSVQERADSQVDMSYPVAAAPTKAQPPLAPSALTPAEPTSMLDVQEQVIADISENRLEAAIALLRRVVAESPHDIAAHLSLGHLCVLTGSLDAGEHCYQLAQRLDPLLPEAHLGLGFARLRRDDYDGAFTALQRAVFLEPRFWATAYLLAEVAERLSLPQIAAREYERTRRLLQAPLVNGVTLETHPIVHAGILPRASVALDRLRARDRDHTAVLERSSG